MADPFQEFAAHYDRMVKENPAEYEKRRGKPLTSQEGLQMQRMLDSNSFLSKLIKLLARSKIVARSDQQNIEFGKGLSSEELKYLHNLILRVIQHQ
jgi:hypothetical protein